MEIFVMDNSATCTKCGETKTLDHFSKDKRKKNGCTSQCLACYRINNRRWRDENPERYAALGQRWRLENRSLVNERARVQVKARRDKRREKAIDYLGGPRCAKCGSVEPMVLEFDHIDPETKGYEISVGLGLPWEMLRDELDKCQILCKNCHAIKTLTEGDYMHKSQRRLHRSKNIDKKPLV